MPEPDLTKNFAPEQKHGIRLLPAGIGARVNLAFAAICLVMFGTLILSWLAFEELGGQISEFNEVRTPSLSRSINLLGIASGFLEKGPSLAVSTTETARRKLYVRLGDDLNRMEVLNSASGQDELSEEDRSRIGRLIERLKTSLTLLNSSAKYRIGLLKEQQRLMDNLTGVIHGSQAALEAFITMPDIQLQTVVPFDRALARLEGQLENWFRIRDEIALNEQSAKISDLLEILSDNMTVLPAPIPTDVFAIKALLDTDKGLLALKKKQVAVDRNTALELERISVKVRQIRLILTLNVKRTERVVQEAADDARDLIRTRTAQLVIAVALVIFLAFLASHVYVRRSLIRRMMLLGQSMERIAKGHLNTPIHTKGEDEIARMADALVVFRNTAREVEEQQTRAIIESSVAGLVMTDKTGCIEFLSNTARQLLGYEETTEPNGSRNIHDLVLGKEKKALSDLIRDQKADAIVELLFRRRDGRIFPGDIACRRIEQRSGTKLIFTLYDVTERKEAQNKLEETVASRTADLQKTNEELRQEITQRQKTETLLRSTKEELVQASKLASLGKMASGISHELNQPLMAVSNWIHNTTLLLEKGDLETAGKALCDMDIQVRRLIELASHLRSLARQPSLEFTPVDPADVLERALGLFSERIRQDKVEINNKLTKGSSSLETDLLRLEQVAINLISNALDAMKKAPSKILTLTLLETDGDRLSLSFTDTGSGINATDLPHLFDPFFTTKDVGKGMGLGLSISYNIARSLGGTIEAGNTGTGASFTISLPRKQDAAAPPLQAEEIW